MRPSFGQFTDTDTLHVLKVGVGKAESCPSKSPPRSTFSSCPLSDFAINEAWEFKVQNLSLVSSRSVQVAFPTRGYKDSSTRSRSTEKAEEKTQEVCSHYKWRDGEREREKANCPAAWGKHWKSNSTSAWHSSSKLGKPQTVELTATQTFEGKKNPDIQSCTAYHTSFRPLPDPREHIRVPSNIAESPQFEKSFEVSLWHVHI